MKELSRHALVVRVTHWVAAVAVFVLLLSGLRIFNAHPALYWGTSSYSGRPPLWEWEAGFPSWLTLPGVQWLAMARRWHFFFGWLLVLNGVFYVAYSLLTRHLTRDLTPQKSDWRTIGSTVREHLRFRPLHGQASQYNVLQKLTYLALIFFLVPALVLMGFAMSPWLDSLLPGWVDLVGGRDSARTLHFVAGGLVVLFVFVHVFEVVLNGFWNNLRSMITGRYRVRDESDR